MNKTYIVRLTDDERQELVQLTKSGKAAASQIKHAHILLQVDANGPNWSDAHVAKALHCHGNTVRNVRQRFVEHGLEAALVRQKQVKPSRQCLLDGAKEAHLIALRCGPPPQGQVRWTLKLLADQLVALHVVETISYETVRQTIKKNLLKPHLHKCWVIPPEHNADFVANMEEVLDLSQRPYDPRHPRVNMDEKPVQLIQETRTPLPAQPGKPARYDYEYERVGTANVFLFTEPLTGWRTIDISAHRTAVDWAHQIKHLLDDCYPDADKVHVVCDNLNTHKLASLYEAFAPEEARRLARRLELHYTPKHGSWLNIAEIELSVLTKQCLDRRIATIETLRQETKAWEHERNAKQTGVDWQFTTEDARIRLKRLYPQYQG